MKKRIGIMLPVSVAAAACLGAGPIGCSGHDGAEDITSQSEALVATLSGTIRDGTGNPLPNVTVRLNGRTQATTTTNAAGAYSFRVNIPEATASWSIMPTRGGCTFTPSVRNLNGVNGNRTANNFTGTGTACVGTTTPPAARATDPGPRPGAAGAGGPPLDDADDPAQQAQAAVACLPNLGPASLLLCEQSFIRFQELDSVSGTIDGEDGIGLGPTFNANGCAVCHSQPSILGGAPAPFSPQNPVPNPQVALATLHGATNVVPSFITANGPVREARFSTDSGVHDLYTIAGRTDAPGCNATQPDFAAAQAAGILSFRIPISAYGEGLIENITEADLEANLAASTSPALGIAGTFNRSGNDGTITRFGWKAQNKSVLIFAGEAYNVEQGISNELFPEERQGGAGNLAGCFDFNGTPEDRTDPEGTGSVSDVHSDVMNFAFAMRLSKPPTPALPPGVTQASVNNGRTTFTNIGCANCHTPTFTTNGKSSIDPALANVVVSPFSDFAIHHMGSGLADGVTQGDAGPDQFRSAPLFGLGQRLFFMHDGRTSDLGVAIEAHSSAGSEANTVITNFNNLSTAAQQDLLNFLRSL